MLLTLRFVSEIEADALEFMHQSSHKAERVRAFFAPFFVVVDARFFV